MIQRTTLLAAVAVLAPTGCPAPDDEPIAGPVPFAYAAYHDDCAPWDGGSTTLYLSDEAVPGPHDPPRPHVSIALYQPASSALGADVRWEGRDDRLGFVARCPEQGECQEASSVLIRLTGQESDGLLEGEVRLDFGAEGAVVGTFQATRIPFEPICG